MIDLLTSIRYKVTKVRDPDTLQNGLLFQIYYPDIKPSVKPRHRFMPSFEQRVEPPNKFCQYLLFAGTPSPTTTVLKSSGAV